MFPCFMSRLDSVYYQPALPVGYVPQWELVLQEKQNKKNI